MSYTIIEDFHPNIPGKVTIFFLDANLECSATVTVATGRFGNLAQ
jgi:hypothetical protein